MRRSSGTLAAVFLACVCASHAVFAQDEASDQAAVWATVEAIWDAEERDQDNWVDTMLAPDFVGWPNESPAPRSRASTRMWARFDADQNKGIEHELYPLSIVVHGDVAIAHYLYTVVVQSRDKTIHNNNGRFTDVLIRNDGEWKFISWHGGHDSD